MDDGRGPGVEKVKAFQDLSAPAPQHLRFHHLEALQITVGRRWKAHFLTITS